MNGRLNSSLLFLYAKMFRSGLVWSGRRRTTCRRRFPRCSSWCSVLSARKGDFYYFLVLILSTSSLESLTLIRSPVSLTKFPSNSPVLLQLLDLPGYVVVGFGVVHGVLPVDQVAHLAHERFSSKSICFFKSRFLPAGLSCPAPASQPLPVVFQGQNFNPVFARNQASRIRKTVSGTLMMILLFFCSGQAAWFWSGRRSTPCRPRCYSISWFLEVAEIVTLFANMAITDVHPEVNVIK